MKDKGLYKRIEGFDIDEGPANLTFSKRLARENGWTLSFAESVVTEYKRFVYLAMVAGHPVTPSDEVDQAWHLHMLYTGSYFNRFCGNVLGRTLAHGPTRGGKDEGEKFLDWYEKTKESYRTEFGTEPPSDVWPSSEVRFGSARYFQRVNTRENLIISKRAIRRALGLVAIGTVASAFIAGCAVGVPLLSQSSGTQAGTILGLFIFGAAVFGLLIYLAKKYGDKSGGGGSGCSAGCGMSGCGSSSCGSGCGGGGCGGGGGD